MIIGFLLDLNVNLVKLLLGFCFLFTVTLYFWVSCCFFLFRNCFISVRMFCLKELLLFILMGEAEFWFSLLFSWLLGIFSGMFSELGVDFRGFRVVGSLF